jgi:glycosyltransferase involved in cell wall biosynthesis
MSFHRQVTPVILTYNEEANLDRTLPKLTWAARVIAVDSGSTDRTLEICASFPNINVVQRKFDSFSSQINHGVSLVSTEWVMVLGSDCFLTDEIISEIGQLTAAPDVSAYIARFKYCINGRPLRASLYPARELIFRVNSGRYIEDGHGERLRVKGVSKQLTGWVYHDDRKPLGRWLSAQNKYASLECNKLLTAPVGELNIQDRLRRRIYFAPLLVFFYLLFVRGLILDGWRGWFYVCQRTIAEILLSLRLLIERERLEPSGQVKE